MNLRSYELISSPTLYPGQTVEAEVELDAADPEALWKLAFLLNIMREKDSLQMLAARRSSFKPASARHLAWTIPDLGGLPIQSVGIEIHGTGGASGSLYLDYLTWSGAPKLLLTRPKIENSLWRRAWVDAVDNWDARRNASFRIVQNEGMGMIAQGTREWTDYQVKASMFSLLAASFGLAVRVQGMRRYYALLLCRDWQSPPGQSDGWESYP